VGILKGVREVGDWCFLAFLLLNWGTLDTHAHTQTFMMLWLTLTYLVGLLPSMVHSQQNLTFIEGFISSLSMLGFTDFGQTLLRINQTSDGQLILEQLSSGANFTVFVPSNDACECCFWPALLAPWHAFVWTVWTSTALFFFYAPASC
jgi:hypothetical protein